MKKIFFALSLLLVSACVLAQVDVQVQADGNRFTSVLASGSTSSKYDIVFIGDGFRETEQAAFNARVDDAVQALRNMAPYSGRMCAFNVWRVNVLSEQSGVDHPANNVFVNSELDCRYGNPANGEAERCVTSNSPAKCYEAAGHAPAYDAIFILVNDSQWGGCAGNLVFSSIAPGFAGIITHELGHFVAQLADEYTCYVCDGTDGNSSYAGAEPMQVNLTKQTNRSLLKWRSFVDASTPIPTINDMPAGVTGLFEGGGYFPLGIYRPQMNCHMKETSSAFCRVCSGRMASVLRGYCPWLIYPDRVRLYKIPYWKIPWCCFCPLLEDYRNRVILPEIDSKQFNAVVVNSNDEIVAQGRAEQNGIVLEFTEKAGESYFVRLTPASGKLEGQEINFQPQLYRNNEKVRLF